MNKLLLAFTFTIVGILMLSSLNVATVVHAQGSSILNTDWSFSVTGLVDHPLNLTVRDLEAMPKTVVTAALFCVDNPNTPLYSLSNWTGVKLSTLLDLAGVSPSTIKVAFNASDGYTTDLNMSTATRGDVILAYENDVSPVIGMRLVVPGLWGYKWISQLTSIVLVDYDFKGTYESVGYPDGADMQSSTNLANVQFPSRVNSKPSNSTPSASSPQPSNSSTTLPPEEPKSSTSDPQPTPSGNFPTELAALVIAAVGISACTLAYDRKRRHRLTTAE